MFGKKPSVNADSNGSKEHKAGDANHEDSAARDLVLYRDEKNHTHASDYALVGLESADDSHVQNFVGFGTAKLQEFQIKSSQSDVLIYTDPKLETPDYCLARAQLIEKLVSGIDFNALQKVALDKRRQRVSEVAEAILSQMSFPLTAAQMAALRQQAMDEILGLGPLEPLLADQEISDIMINGYKQIYVEKRGKVYLSDVTFLNEKHLMGIIQRIVNRVGRRVDESSPMVDARLSDGSRFNAIIPPLALDGSLVSIRKFKKNKMSLRDYLNYDSLSVQMCEFLELAGSMRMNILISGGTGSGKTTLLNAISGNIDPTERVVTIEDAAELSLLQPHVLRLETRPMSSEGTGEVTQRQLVKNALRMRPDRIILGEIRGEEVIDVLQAMNTGHDGSMATIHANTPRDCLARVESLIGMAGIRISEESQRYQISSAIQLIVQLQRMRDGRRRITHIEEVVGLEGTQIITQTLFEYKTRGMNANGVLDGDFLCTGTADNFMPRAEYFGVVDELIKCFAKQG
jgi:pilus assembly protein CpaF